MKQRYEVFLEEACKRFERVLFVLGNHEYYCKHEVKLSRTSFTFIT